jgi:putative addiction module killer protein
MIDIRRYCTAAGKDAFGEWLARLKDVKVRARILVRIDHLSLGNFGDNKSLGGGLFEMRLHWGPGYRVYYSLLAPDCVLLLCGGTKRQQASDIQRARGYLRDYQKRTPQK